MPSQLGGGCGEMMKQRHDDHRLIVVAELDVDYQKDDNRPPLIIAQFSHT